MTTLALAAAAAAANAALAEALAVEAQARMDEADARTVLLNAAGQCLRYREVALVLAVDESYARELGARGEWKEVVFGANAVRVPMEELVAYVRRKARIRRRAVVAA